MGESVFTNKDTSLRSGTNGLESAQRLLLGILNYKLKS